MCRIGAIRSAGLFVFLLCTAPIAVADQALVALDNNAWAGNANLGVYPPSSGALIDYELLVRIEDAENDGFESQGLSLFEVDILTNTGILQPEIVFSPTTEEYPYTILDALWTAGKAPVAVGGFGMGFIFQDGTQVGDDVIAAGATFPLLWVGDTSSAPGSTPAALAGIGFGKPGVGTFDSGGNPFPAFGTARSEWYLLRGQTIVPDDPGDYVVDVSVGNFNVLRTSVDLNNDYDSLLVKFFPPNDITATGFQFSVAPEPATAGALLLAGGLLLRRRRHAVGSRSDNRSRTQSRRLPCGLLVAFVLAAPSVLQADVVTFALDNNAWAGNANMGTYPPSSGAMIDYELFVQIEDVESDGYNSQGVSHIALDILTNTNIQQPILSPSPTTIEYIYTVMDATWTGGPSPIALGGFGYTQFAPGLNDSPVGDVRFIAANVPLNWIPDTSPVPGITPRALAGIGIGTPGAGTVDSGGNAFPFYGTGRGKWYLLRGQILVPDAPGQYEVAPDIESYGIIGLDADLNTLIEGYQSPPGSNQTLAEAGFSFAVSPEPATLSLLLISAGVIVGGRRSLR